MQESLECAICSEGYNEVKRPITLGCGHTFCKICIMSKYANQLIQCFLCQKTFKIKKKEDFVVNYALENCMQEQKNKGAPLDNFQITQKSFQIQKNGPQWPNILQEAKNQFKAESENFSSSLTIFLDQIRQKYEDQIQYQDQRFKQYCKFISKMQQDKMEELTSLLSNPQQNQKIQMQDIKNTVEEYENYTQIKVPRMILNEVVSQQILDLIDQQIIINNNEKIQQFQQQLDEFQEYSDDSQSQVSDIQSELDENEVKVQYDRKLFDLKPIRSNQRNLILVGKTSKINQSLY